MTHRTPLTLLAAALMLTALLIQPAAAEDREMTLITETPQEGFELAITLARKGVTSTQPDKAILHKLREDYSNEAGSLIDVSHVIAVHFRTIAQANDYWRE